MGASNWRNNYFFFPVNKAQTSGAGFQTISFSATASGATQTDQASSFTRPVSESFAYDADGNLTEDGLWAYAYDAENRLRAMYSKVADGTGAPVAVVFSYDYLGRRVIKSAHSYSGTYLAPTLTTLRSKTYFAYQGWTLVAEYDGNTSIGELRRRFTWGAALSGADDVGSLLAIEDVRTAYSGTYLTVHDGNGNLTALVQAQGGATVAEYEYDPFGNLLRSSGRYGKENPFRFAGKYLDSETGLSYYGFRYYSASLGRFINRDPISEAGGLNIYGFANNDGINGGDLFGLAWWNSWSDFKSSVGGLWGGFTSAWSRGYGALWGGLMWGAGKTWHGLQSGARHIAFSAVNFVVNTGRHLVEAGRQLMILRPILTIRVTVGIATSVLSGDIFDKYTPPDAQATGSAVNGIWNSRYDAEEIARNAQKATGQKTVAIMNGTHFGIPGVRQKIGDVLQCISEALGAINTPSLNYAHTMRAIAKNHPSGVLEATAHSQGGSVLNGGALLLDTSINKRTSVQTFGAQMAAVRSRYRDVYNERSSGGLLGDPVPFLDIRNLFNTLSGNVIGNPQSTGHGWMKNYGVPAILRAEKMEGP